MILEISLDPAVENLKYFMGSELTIRSKVFIFYFINNLEGVILSTDM